MSAVHPSRSPSAPAVRVVQTRSGLSSRWWARYSPAVRAALPWWLISRAAFMLAMLIGAHWLSATQTVAVFDYPYASGDVWHLWDHHDTRHYLAIAAHGYTAPYDSNFFPLYPLLVRALAWPFLPAPLLTGALLAASLGALVLLLGLARLAALQQAGHAALRAPVAALLAYPLAIFLVAPWSDSVTAAALVWALVFLQERRWGWVALCAVLAALAHITAVVLVLPAAWVLWQEWRRTQRLRPAALVALTAVPVTLGAYSLFCLARFGDALCWVHTQQQYFAHHLSAPWVTLGAVAANLRSAPLWSGTTLRLLVDLGPLALVLLVLCGGWRTLSPAHRLYLLGLIALCVTVPVWGPGTYADAIVSTGRYLLAAAPAFVLVGQTLARRPRIAWAVGLACVALQGALLGAYFLGGWIV